MEGTRIALALSAPPIISRKSAKAAVGSRQQTQIAADSFSQRHKGACSATLGPVLSGVCSDPVSQRSWLSLVLSGACSVAKCRPVLRRRDGPALRGAKASKTRRSARSFYARSSTCGSTHSGAVSVRHSGVSRCSCLRLARPRARGGVRCVVCDADGGWRSAAG